MIGQTISHYSILEKLGEGGMGVVYKARDTKLDRFVALKFLPFEVAADAPERARFLQEAKAAAALNHPNICTIHDLAEHDKQQFIVMEYVEGVTLRQKVAESKQSLKDLIEWASQIADAIQAAHEAGITHRDIKSDNIMVNTKNQIKVMDFGLAKLKGALKLTKTTSTVGTLAYMAPEQLQGLETDARMDIFSFGVVLYEMLAGCLPFRAEYESALMYAIVNMDPEPIAKYRPGLSSELLHLLNRALEKDPKDRYQTMQEVLVELRRVKRDSARVRKQVSGEIPSPETRPLLSTDSSAPGRKRFLFYTGTVTAIAIIAGLGFWLFRFAGKSPVPRLVHPTPVTTAVGVEDFPTWRPDGTEIAYESNQSGNWDIWVTQVHGGNPVNRTADHSGQDRAPSWSPDGTQIAFWSDRDGGGYFVMSALGSPPRKVVDMASTPFTIWQRPPAWSTSGRKLACISFSEEDLPTFYAEVVSLEDGSSRRIPLPGVTFGRFYLAWSPDGRYLAYVSCQLATVS